MIAFPVYALCYHDRLFELELNWLTGFLTFLGVDFCFYWMHRASHRMRWFWAAHVVHHSSERMNFSTAMRQNRSEEHTSELQSRPHLVCRLLLEKKKKKKKKIPTHYY